jgi:hypothetical protein
VPCVGRLVFYGYLCRRVRFETSLCLFRLVKELVRYASVCECRHTVILRLLSCSFSFLALGPMAHAIAAFLTVQSEIQSEMLGILRGLGLRDSVYWTSWWIPFLLTSATNALLGAIAAQVVSVHVYETVYFGGVFGAIFFLNLALVGASLFVAALCGTSRGSTAIWFILLMIIAVWVPLIVQSSEWSIPTQSGLDSLAVSSRITPLGLFWLNFNTSLVITNYTGDELSYDECQAPIIDEFQGNFHKTAEERMNFPEDDWFVG